MKLYIFYFLFSIFICNISYADRIDNEFNRVTNLACKNMNILFSEYKKTKKYPLSFVLKKLSTKFDTYEYYKNRVQNSLIRYYEPMYNICYISKSMYNNLLENTDTNRSIIVLAAMKAYNKSYDLFQKTKKYRDYYKQYNMFLKRNCSLGDISGSSHTYNELMCIGKWNKLPTIK